MFYESQNGNLSLQFESKQLLLIVRRKRVIVQSYCCEHKMTYCNILC